MQRSLNQRYIVILYTYAAYVHVYNFQITLQTLMDSSHVLMHIIVKKKINILLVFGKKEQSDM